MSIIMKVQRTCSFLLFNTEGTTIKPSGPYPSVLGTAPVTTSAIKFNKAITSHGSEIQVRLGFSLSLEPLNLPFTPIVFLCLSRLVPPTSLNPSTHLQTRSTTSDKAYYKSLNTDLRGALLTTNLQRWLTILEVFKVWSSDQQTLKLVSNTDSLAPLQILGT